MASFWNKLLAILASAHGGGHHLKINIGGLPWTF